MNSGRVRFGQVADRVGSGWLKSGQVRSSRVGLHQVRLGWVVIVTGRVWWDNFFYCLQIRFGYATRLTRKQTVGV